jgi:hypothetical protein
VPTLTGPAEVLWEKGHNLNQFTVGGKLFAKVGSDAPPALAACGFRDVWIGDRERSRGEWIRPQVSHQHDPLFLLASTGSFVAQVMSVVSRLATLQIASGKCAADLKKQKQLLGVRRDDLTAAQRKLDALTPIVALHERVTRLRQQVVEVAALDQRVSAARRLLSQRRAVAPAASCTLPEVVMVPEIRYTELRDLVLRRRGVLAAARVAFPAGASQRAGRVLDASGRMAEGTKLARVRALVKGTAEAVLPPARDWPDPVRKVEHWAARADTVRERDGIRTKALERFHQAVSACRASKQEAELAELTLQEVLATLHVCPVCERPMEVA